MQDSDHIQGTDPVTRMLDFANAVLHQKNGVDGRVFDGLLKVVEDVVGNHARTYLEHHVEHDEGNNYFLPDNSFI